MFDENLRKLIPLFLCCNGFSWILYFEFIFLKLTACFTPPLGLELEPRTVVAGFNLFVGQRKSVIKATF